jgi:hypothetical protein
MSKSGPSETSIPVVILLSQSEQPNKANRPYARRRSASTAQQLPWLWIAVGGGVAWIVVVLVIVVTCMTREPEQPNAAAIARLGAVEPAFQAPVPPRGEEVEPEAVAVPEAVDEPAAFNAPAPGPFVADKRMFADCQQIGTNVKFMRDPPEAFKRAKVEKKMVFIVHLSGNLEDKEFT